MSESEESRKAFEKISRSGFDKKAFLKAADAFLASKARWPVCPCCGAEHNPDGECS